MPDRNKANRRDFLKTGAVAVAGGITGSRSALDQPGQFIGGGLPVPEKVVVLTFDDAVKSHRTVVAPLLKELGFGATFFISHAWMTSDPKHYLTWMEIAELHEMGFEIGNHSWTHPSFAVPKNAARLPAELGLVERELRRFGFPRPISFSWCGNHFGPEALQQLIELDYQLARRGTPPEIPYGSRGDGSTFDPKKHHPLLIPSTGVADPSWTLEHFRQVVKRARAGEVAVLQFHGVPDPHAFASTPPERFSEYMAYLKEQGFKVIALRDLKRYLPQIPVADPLLKVRSSAPNDPSVRLPTEVEATRAGLGYWLENMFRHHHYAGEEAAKVTGLTVVEVKASAKELGLDTRPPIESQKIEEVVRVLPYPGGRHPRIGFLDGAILPQRGTKASVFLPWDPASYVVLDLPEAIFSNLGLTFLAHTDVPTIWDARNIVLENIDWSRNPDGSLTGSRVLPNQITFGASVQPSTGKVEMELWLRNNSPEKLIGLRTQICAMLKGAPDFNSQTNDNKIFRSPVCAVKSLKGNRWILMAWDRCGRAWGNSPVPCMHADPVLADCLPGETVRARGRLWFYEGGDIDSELGRAQRTFAALPVSK